MGDPGLGGDVGIQELRCVAEPGADRCHAHRRAVASGVDAAVPGPEPEPQLQDGPQRGQADAGGQGQEPPAQAPTQTTGEALRRVGMGKQRLGDHERVFGVVAEHAATQEEAMPQARLAAVLFLIQAQEPTGSLR